MHEIYSVSLSEISKRINFFLQNNESHRKNERKYVSIEHPLICYLKSISIGNCQSLRIFATYYNLIKPLLK